MGEIGYVSESIVALAAYAKAPHRRKMRIKSQRLKVRDQVRHGEWRRYSYPLLSHVIVERGREQPMLCRWERFLFPCSRSFRPRGHRHGAATCGTAGGHRLASDACILPECFAKVTHVEGSTDEPKLSRSSVKRTSLASRRALLDQPLAWSAVVR